MYLFGALMIVALMMPALVISQSVFTNPSAVSLGTAANYRAVSGTALSIGTGCAITGNVAGVTGITNLGTVSGTQDNANPNATTAKSDLDAAFAELMLRAVDSTLTVVDMGGMTLGRGIYKANASGTLGLTGTLTLTGTATDIFIIRTGTSVTPGTSLITAASSIVTMGGTALASNVYWVIGTSSEMGATSTFKGSILSGTTVLQNATVSFDGRAMGKTTVTLNGTSVMPVELVSFTASSNQKSTNLHWTTATEVNNFGFEIERTMDNGQLTIDQWNKVGFVEGNGTTNSPKNYSYTDNNLISGTYSYRLKQIDRDGKFEYSQSVEVTIGQAPKEFALMQNYPNPFNPSTTINYQLPMNSHISLKVYDMLGNEVATLVNQTKEAGSYTAEFDGSKLSSGVYFYTINAGNFSTTKKLTLMK